MREEQDEWEGNGRSGRGDGKRGSRDGRNERLGPGRV